MIENLPHLCSKEPDAEKKYQLYLKLREEGLKVTDSDSEVVSRVKELSDE